MTELRKSGTNQHEVLAHERVIGQVWNWHGNWTSEANDETHHGFKSRKEAIVRVEHTQRRRP